MLVSKGEFARMVGRHPGAVSHWISTGKLTAPALVGPGRSAKVDVQAALGQLGLTLDLGQQLAQAQPITAAIQPRLTAPPPNDDLVRLQRLRADREQLELNAAAAKAEQMAGRWMLTARARDAWSTELAGLIQAVESWLVTTAAREIATLESRDPRAIGAALREGFRALRQRLAEKAAAPPPPPGEAEEDDADAEPAELGA